MKEDARKMVLTMVDMERSYLTADVFRDIISQNGATDGVEQPNLLRTLSGDPVARVNISYCASSMSSPIGVVCQSCVPLVSRFTPRWYAALCRCHGYARQNCMPEFMNLLAWQDCHASNFAVTVCSEHG